MPVDPGSLQIVYFPEEILRARSAEIDAGDEMVRAVARRMIELMHEAEGVGLAAPQVGLPWRLFVTNAREADPVDRVFINPRLTLPRCDLVSEEEGCLSIPGIHVQVRRAVRAEVSAVDLDGNPFSMTAEGFLARVWQHEFDHLEGVLIIDRMSPIDRIATRKALKAMEAEA